MKTFILATLVLVAASASAACQHSYCQAGQPPRVSAPDRLKLEMADVGVQAFTASDYKPGLIRHIVLFRYTDETTALQKEEVKQRFLALQESKRDGKRYIQAIETGSQISGEGVDDSLEQAFLVTFRSQGDRNFYVGQPIVMDSRYYDANHQAFKDFVGPLLHKDPLGVLVFDYAAN